MPDLYGESSSSRDSFGRKGDVITPNDSTDLPDVVKGVVVTDITGGANIEVLPVENADGNWIPFVNVPIGFIPPYQVRRVRTTTTCTVASVYDLR